MNTPNEPPDSSPKPKRHLALVPPLPTDEPRDQSVSEPQSMIPTGKTTPDPIPPYKTPWQVKLVAGTFCLFVGTETYNAFQGTLEQKNGAVAAGPVDDAQNGTHRRVVQTIAIYPNGHLETVAEKDVLAAMYPDPKDLCTARIISMTKQIQAETGGVLPSDLIVVANADGVRCKHDEKRGKYNLEFTQ